ncbi:hypothetical protein [Bradyrhizobium sp.]|uniref:hypothetical protein n=1 Tax=Bradyrhizobium sp. TaxID=376 RepID=UPI0025C6B39B|nr:hypothetical protein [Bradyrhizobium sp.]
MFGQTCGNCRELLCRQNRTVSASFSASALGTDPDLQGCPCYSPVIIRDLTLGPTTPIGCIGLKLEELNVSKSGPL